MFITVSYDRSKTKKSVIFCTHMVDFYRPGHIYTFLKCIMLTYRPGEQHIKWQDESYNQQDWHINDLHKVFDDCKQHVDRGGNEAESFQCHQHRQPGQARTERTDIPLPSLSTPFVISISDHKKYNENS